MPSKPSMSCALALSLLACGAPRPRPTPAPAAAVVAVVAAPVDPDGDGVAGEADRCPDAAEDCDGTDDADGCPDPDDDHDGIVDLCDACPQTPGQSPDGCDHRVILVEEQIRVVSGVYFALHSAALRPDAQRVLDEVAALLRARPEVLRVEVGAHASSNERNPEALNQRRADAVLQALVTRGVEATRLVAHAYGSAQPVEPNTTAAGQARNRRVEFRVLDMQPPPPQPPPPPRHEIAAGCPDHPTPQPPRRCAEST